MGSTTHPPHFSLSYHSQVATISPSLSLSPHSVSVPISLALSLARFPIRSRPAAGAPPSYSATMDEVVSQVTMHRLLLSSPNSRSLLAFSDATATGLGGCRSWRSRCCRPRRPWRTSSMRRSTRSTAWTRTTSRPCGGRPSSKASERPGGGCALGAPAEPRRAEGRVGVRHLLVGVTRHWHRPRHARALLQRPHAASAREATTVATKRSVALLRLHALRLDRVTGAEMYFLASMYFSS
jgi:hypothetical protein